jgi:protein-disulfide reductase (glutathione)
MQTNGRKVFVAATLAALVVLVGVGSARAGGDWNDAKVQWQPYEQGLAAAKKDKKPVMLVFYTEWCPHCRNFSKMFHDEKVVEKSKSFTMIRLDKDKNAEISKKYAPDGEYIPRTYFLSSDGTLDPTISAFRTDYKYFYDEANPSSILGGMDAALKKLK